MEPIRIEIEKQRLFKCTNQFAYLEKDEPRFSGDHVSDPVVSWSGSSVFEGDDTRFVVALNFEEAKEKMKQYILNYPEGFGFFRKYIGRYTKEQLVKIFQEAFNQEVDEKNPKLGQHRIKVEEIENVIF